MTQRDQSEQPREKEGQAQFTEPAVERFDLKASFEFARPLACGCGCGCSGGGGAGGGGGGARQVQEAR